MSRRIALVTGGARGVGAAVCRNLAGNGYDVLVNFHSSIEAVQKLVEELSKSCHALYFQGDVSSPEAVDALFDYCKREFGGLDVLVNNASYSSESGWNAGFDQINWLEWQKTIDVDVKGTMMCSHAAFALMKAQGSGKIINFSSSAALWGDVPTYFYTAAKSAIVGLTRTMAKAFAPQVQVNCIAPGSIATDWITKWKLSADEVDAIAQESPSRRIGTAEEVASLVAFLASPECKFMTGQTMIIDGGIIMP